MRKKASSRPASAQGKRRSKDEGRERRPSSEGRPERKPRFSKEGSPPRKREGGPRPPRGNAERDDKPAFRKREEGPRGRRPVRREGDRDERPSFRKREDGPRGKRPVRREGDREERPPFRKREDGRPSFSSRPPRRRAEDDRPSYTSRPPRRGRDEGEGEARRPGRISREGRTRNAPPRFSDRPRRTERNDGRRTRPRIGEERKSDRKKADARSSISDDSTSIRLNRFISNAGVCSRRDADALITAGKIRVNGEVVTTLGTKVNPRTDNVDYEGRQLIAQKYIYLLLNKPRNYITTTDDEKGRRTVMEIVETYTPERVYPVGRLDRNSTGLLLFTNDGELAEKLTHPSHGVRKVYHVRLNRPVTEEHLAQLKNGITLEDGFIQADAVDYVTGAPQNEVGVVIHSGRNHIVRRMFAHLGYEVMGLDRTGFANLNKKKLPRGQARFLEPQEVAYLKMI